MSKMLAVVDLFCGAGGLSYGLKKMGFNIKAGYDIDPACEYPYTSNIKASFYNKDIRLVTPQEILSHFQEGEVKVLAGCAPCQPFSSYSKTAKARISNRNNGRWDLLKEFQRLIAGVNPEIVTLENVPGLEKQEVWRCFKRFLEGKKFHVTYRIVKCEEIGLPQRRRRLVMIASRLSKVNLEGGPTPIVSVKDAIGSLHKRHKLSAGEQSKKDPMHIAAGLTLLNVRRIQASKPGGSWSEWPTELQLTCHKKPSGRSYGSVYGRMRWNEPAPTITTQCYGYGNGRFGHPEQDRAISLREAAILQSFPEDYSFFSPGERVSISTLARLIGNAVPPQLGEFVGEKIKDSIFPA